MRAPDILIARMSARLCRPRSAVRELAREARSAPAELAQGRQRLPVGASIVKDAEDPACDAPPTGFGDEALDRATFRWLTSVELVSR